MSEPKKVGRRTFLNYAIAVVATGVIVGAATYFAVPKEVTTVTAPGTTVTTTKTVTTTVTGTPTTSPTPTETVPFKEGVKPLRKYPGVKVTALFSTHSAWMGPLVDLWAKETGAQVEALWLAVADLEAKAMTDLAQGVSWDIVQLDDPWYGEFEPFIIPVSQWPSEYRDYIYSKEYDLDDITKGALKMPTHKGELWGLPYRTGARMLFYRKDLYQKYGLKVPPATEEYYFWDEGNEPSLLKDLIALKPEIPNTYPFGVMAKQGGANAYHYISEWLWPWGGTVLDEKDNWRPKLDSREALESLTFYVDLLHKYGVMHPESVAWEWSEIQTAQQKGKVAVTNLYTPYATAMNDPTKSDVAGKMGYALVPKGPPPKGISTSAVGGWSFSITKFSKNKEAAADLIINLTNKEGQLLMAKLGNGPTRKSVFAHPDMKWMWWSPTIIASLERARTHPKIPEWPKIHIKGQEVVAKALARIMTPKEALDEWQKYADSLLREAGYYK